MSGAGRFNANVAPFLVPLLALGGLPMSGVDGDELATPAFFAVAGLWVALLGLAFYWRVRGRAAGGGGRAGLCIALWVFAGLSVMMLNYKLLWSLEHASGPFDEPLEVGTRGFQAGVFYIAAAVIGSRRSSSGDSTLAAGP